MKLDELLESESKVVPRDSLARESTRSALISAAHNDIARRAKIVRLRRRRALAACAGVAVIAGIAAVRSSGPENPARRVDTRTRGTTTPISTNFRTVAEVVDAAAAAPSVASPGLAPYWKVLTTVPGTVCSDNRCHSSSMRATYWIGLDGPGVQMLGDPGRGEPLVGSTGTLRVAIDGRWMTWRQANAHTWTTTQLKTIRFEGFNPNHGPWLDVPAWYRTGYDVASALITAPASHAIREHLWKILGTIPELQLQGRAKDSLGRPGWRLTLPSAGTGWPAESYIVDAATGVILEYKEHSPSTPAGITVVSAGPADSAPTPTPTCPNGKETKGQGVSVCVASISH